MTEDIFIYSHNAKSDRFAILDDNETVAFLYLTHRGTQKPEKDAIAYMRITPLTQADWNEMAKTGKAPLLSQEFATGEAVIANPSAEDFSFHWSQDGETAALKYRGRSIALVSTLEKRGYSRSVSKASALANPWSDSVYESLFRQ